MPKTNTVVTIGLCAALIAILGALAVLMEAHTHGDQPGEPNSLDRDRRLTSVYESARTDPAARSALLDPRNLGRNDAFLQHFHVLVCTPHDSAVLTTGNAHHPSPLAERTIDPDLDAALCRFTLLNLKPTLLKGTNEQVPTIPSVRESFIHSALPVDTGTFRSIEHSPGLFHVGPPECRQAAHEPSDVVRLDRRSAAPIRIGLVGLEEILPRTIGTHKSSGGIRNAAPDTLSIRGCSNRPEISKRPTRWSELRTE